MNTHSPRAPTRNAGHRTGNARADVTSSTMRPIAPSAPPSWPTAPPNSLVTALRRAKRADAEETTPPRATGRGLSVRIGFLAQIRAGRIGCFGGDVAQGDVYRMSSTGVSPMAGPKFDRQNVGPDRIWPQGRCSRSRPALLNRFGPRSIGSASNKGRGSTACRPTQNSERPDLGRTPIDRTRAQPGRSLFGTAKEQH